MILNRWYKVVCVSSLGVSGYSRVHVSKGRNLIFDLSYLQQTSGQSSQAGLRRGATSGTFLIA